MGGERRLLQSLRKVLASLVPLPSGFVEAGDGLAGALALSSGQVTLAGPPRRREGRRAWGRRLRVVCSAHVTQVGLIVLFLAGTALYGALRGGQYDDFVDNYGAPRDLVARAFGLGISAITITGERELVESQILAAAQITPRNSLLFLDVEAMRGRLKALHLVQDVSIRKLYPDRLLIQITERRPSALWQKDGDVNLIAADGTVLDQMHDLQDANLPFVVGDGANKRVGEFTDLVAAAGDIGPKIRAGVLVSGRRWDLKMESGLEVKLPEIDPADAVRQFVRLVHDDQLLDKDLISVDLRIPGRLTARISGQAAAARAQAQAAAKKHGKGPAT
jgi:cell division protein FtsQ